MSKELLLAVWLGLASLVLFIMMGSDKRKAVEGKRRISEKALFIWAIIGGGIGGFLGMQVFRHKTKHWYFKLFFPLFAILQLAAMGYVMYNFK